jgi:hypothetical protein
VFEPWSGYVGFVVEEVPLGQVSSWYFAFPFNAIQAEALRASLKYESLYALYT